jgi:hypothetical protein
VASPDPTPRTRARRPASGLQDERDLLDELERRLDLRRHGAGLGDQALPERGRLGAPGGKSGCEGLIRRPALKGDRGQLVGASQIAARQGRAERGHRGGGLFGMMRAGR